MPVYTSENRFGEEIELGKVGSYLCYAGYSAIYISITNSQPLLDFVPASLISRTPLNILIGATQLMINEDIVC
jgi:hypothetical protein